MNLKGYKVETDGLNQKVTAYYEASGVKYNSEYISPGGRQSSSFVSTLNYLDRHYVSNVRDTSLFRILLE